MIDFNNLNRSLLPRLDSILCSWLPDGHREGKEYVARNPLRLDRTPGSFRINRCTGRWGDFATGDRGGDIISLYAYLYQIGQVEAAKALSLQSASEWHHVGISASKPAKAAKVERSGDTQICQRILAETIAATDTLVAEYLNIRGYSGMIPDTLRYHPQLLHTPTKTAWPAMVAAVMLWPGNQVIAVHRTYLARDGRGKAPITPNKMMLGSVAGGAVRFGTPSNTLVVAEGIETALSAHYVTGLPVWAALSASNMKALVLPPLNISNEIIIAADHDGAGLAAAYDSAQKWSLEGIRVKVALPPEGQDFNDVLMGGTV